MIRIEIVCDGPALIQGSCALRSLTSSKGPERVTAISPDNSTLGMLKAVRDARHRATAARGWRFVKGKFYCPFCNLLRPTKQAASAREARKAAIALAEAAKAAQPQVFAEFGQSAKPALSAHAIHEGSDHAKA